MRIAVAGNPNCGKSTLFNALSGARARVGNYPGVTVEHKSAPFKLPSGRRGELVDLPGCTSLVARSIEEDVAHGVLLGGPQANPIDTVISVVDATQLGRGLYLVLQLKELGLRQVLALNMMDAAEARGMHLHVAALARSLDLRVTPMVAQSGAGLQDLRVCLDGCSSGTPPRPGAAALAHLELTVEELAILQGLARTVSMPEMPLGNVLWLICSDLASLTPALHGAMRPVLTDGRLRDAVDQARRALDALCGPHGFARSVIERRYAAVDRAMAQVYVQRGRVLDERTRRADRLLLHPAGGPLLFGCTMFGLFQGVFLGAEPLMTALEGGVAQLAQQATNWLPSSLAASLLIEGVLPAVGSVASFVPQIALLFAGMAVLEESGYMARAAFLLDALMRRVGLHGKAFIPLLTSFGCAIPGIMAARTIESPRDRLVTIFIAPLMSCSARLPVYTLVVAATLAHLPPLWGVVSIGGLAILGMYCLGFVAAIAMACVLKRTALRAPAPPLLLDLPRLQLPPLGKVLGTTCERCAVFIKQTGGIILALSVLLWGALNFPRYLPPPATQVRQAQALIAPATAQQTASAQRAETLKHSIGGTLGRAIEPLIAPLGFDWRIGIALVASFAAREVLVSTLGQIYALEADTPATSPALRQALRSDVDPQTGQPRFTWLVGLSLMVFFVLAMQCLSTVAVVKRETGGWRWPVAQLVTFNTLAYVASLTVYQGGRALGWG